MTSDRNDVDELPDTRSGNRLGIDDWLAAGYAILAEEGLKALKIDRLCARLGVTKGSFYWHFDNIAAYRTALVQGWSELRDADRSQIEEIDALPPRDRLIRMMNSLVSPRHWTLERAMREWARSDQAVAESVRAADRRILAAVRRAFEDYGFDADEVPHDRRGVRDSIVGRMERHGFGFGGQNGVLVLKEWQE